MREPTRSILPNSDPSILRPLAGLHGTFEVRWNEGLDEHVLFFNGSPVATHHNGYSVFNLAKRVMDVLAGTRDTNYAWQQAAYIQACGGMCRSEEFIRRMCEPKEPRP